MPPTLSAWTKGLLDLVDQRERSCEAADVIAREHLAEVERKLADLAALCRELISLLGHCWHGKADHRIIDALAPAVPTGREVRYVSKPDFQPWHNAWGKQNSGRQATRKAWKTPVTNNGTRQ